jgi:L-ascorbate metabolism protein UlaG (beta-lactamase superfamily)
MWSDEAVTLAWLGHSTVLINFYGVRILTDPVLYRRVGVNLGLGTLGPLRLVQGALSRHELPEIDLVLVSHAHFDHLDRPSLRSLRGLPAAVMAWGTADLLPRRRFRSVAELRWNESSRVTTSHGDVVARAIEVKHWGARIGRDRWRGYAGFVVEREGRRLLIAGDTAMTPIFREHRRFGPFDAAVMPIGRLQPVDLRALHARASRRHGQCRGRAINRARAPSIVSPEQRAVHGADRARAAGAGRRARAAGAA